MSIVRQKKNKYLAWLLLICLPFAMVHAAEFDIIDLTYPFDNKTNYWPTEKGFERTVLFYGKRPAGYFYSAGKFCAPEHGGTHLDAPRHFNEHGLTVDMIPTSQLTGHALVIHVEKQVGNNPNYLISKNDIVQFEKKHRQLSDQDIVLFYTGWGQYWSNKKQYMGSDKLGDVKDLHFPGLSKEAAEYLVAKHIKGVGLDTASMDAGDNENFVAHRIILGANMYGLENVANLDKVPEIGADIIVAPMKIVDGSGAPTRIYAVIPKTSEGVNQPQ